MSRLGIRTAVRDEEEVMVIVGLTGGIGNQLFQYALGRALCSARGDQLWLYTYLLDKAGTPRSYCLDHFGIKANLISEPAAFANLCTEADSLWTVKELSSTVTNEIFNATQENLMLWGSWQSEKYFKVIEEALREELRPRSTTFKGRLEIPAGFAAGPSVCLHVRRTDYLVKGDLKGFVGLDYYRNAVSRIRQLDSSVHILVFSDDIDWCRANLKIESQHSFVSQKGRSLSEDVRELLMMASCDHFVIANSTFSWWAAWLGNSPRKQVIAPRRWFRSEPVVHADAGWCLRFDSRDLIPDRWLRI